tara:strand:+ start:2296 stop:3048 length:753 start_codon:yes stop_codon:yes gene_type:complete
LKTIIQIGTADGDDEVFSYLQKNGFDNYNVYFIEPNKYSRPLIEEQYENLKNKAIFPIAITHYDGDVDMFFDSNYETGRSYHSSVRASFSKNDEQAYSFPEVLGHKKEEIKKVRVPCLTLNTFMLKYVQPDTEIEHLFIDAEGCDCDIVSKTDFSNLIINNITFEYIHAGGVNGGMGKKEFRDAVQNLQENGFYLEKTEIEADYNGSTFTKDWISKGGYNVTFAHKRVISFDKKDDYVRVDFVAPKQRGV